MNTNDARAAAAAEAALTIRDEARAHKRLENLHRREARRLMERFAELREQCARAGIHFDTTEPKEAESNG
jgi:hypothetical protein